jgi:curved DNA-binding protein CbpA
MWYRLATIINDEQLMSELTNNATTSEDIKSNYRMLVKKYHPDVNQDPDSTENIKNLTRVYEEVKDSTIPVYKSIQTDEKETTSEEVEEYMEDANNEEEVRNALGLLVSTYFVRNVPEAYDTPDYTVDDHIVSEIMDKVKNLNKPYENIAFLINLVCGKFIKENY